MIWISIGVIIGILISLALGWWSKHREDGSSLRDLDKYSGRF